MALFAKADSLNRHDPSKLIIIEMESLLLLSVPRGLGFHAVPFPLENAFHMLLLFLLLALATRSFFNFQLAVLLGRRTRSIRFPLVYLGHFHVGWLFLVRRCPPSLFSFI